MNFQNLICLIVGSFFIASCSSRVVEEQEVSGEMDSLAVPLQVSVVLAQERPLSELIEAIGEITSSQVKELSFLRDGVLDQLRVHNGTSITKGAEVAGLNNSLERMAVREARLNYQQAYYQDEDERMFLSDSSFYKDRWKEVDEKTALKSGLPQARVAWERAELELQQTFLAAPFTGKISDLTVHVGDHMVANDRLCTLYDPSQLEISLELLEYDFPKLKTGQKAEVEALALPAALFQGVVTEINPMIGNTGHFLVKVRLVGDLLGLVPGMSAEVRVILEPSESHILVPLESVIHKSGRDVVFTYEGGLAKWHYVTLGNQNGQEVEVLEGLDPDSQVITSKVYQLTHDSPVLLDNASDPTAHAVDQRLHFSPWLGEAPMVFLNQMNSVL